jgi:hypothetical protein
MYLFPQKTFEILLSSIKDNYHKGKYEHMTN